MSYQVLARKWRPRFFREMVGQEHVLQALINALDHNRLHHAYLFTGTRGVGKTTIARILAKCLNCEVGVSSEPCGQCSACLEINQGSFIDLIEIDAASYTGVDNMREIIDNAQYRPTKGRYKVYIIDEVHMLSKSAFNALLKTLEEPPEHVKFLLATTDPQKLPATILSRCLQFHLKNMVPERIVGHLQHILQQEMVEFEEPALWALARSADGSMRDGLSLTDQAIAFGSGKITESDVRDMLGSIDQQTVYHLAQALVAHDAKKLLAVIADFSEQAPDYAGVLDELLLLLHRVTIAQVVPEAVDNALGDQDKVTALAQSVTAEELQLFYQMGLMAKKDFALAPDLRSGLEMAVLRMLVFRPQGLTEPPSKVLPQTAESVVAAPNPAPVATEVEIKKPEASVVASIAAEVEVVKSTIEIVPQEKIVALVESIIKPVIAANDAPVVVQPQADFKLLQDNAQWLAVFAQIPFNGLLGAVAAECILLGREGNCLHLVLNQQNAQLYNERHAGQIAQTLSDFFAVPVEVNITLKQEGEYTGVKTPAIYRTELKKEAYDQALSELQQDAGMQHILQTYAGNIVTSSIAARVKTNTPGE